MSTQTKNYTLLFVGWITLYLSQRTVPSTVSYLENSADFSLKDIGNVLSSFGLTYSLTKLASGLLYDNLQLNPKFLFCSGLGVAGLLCVCFPLAANTSTSLSCLLWMVAGVFQGFGWPACARMLKRWYKPSDIGRKYFLLSSAANTASAVVPMMAVYMTAVLGWQYTYYTLGICSLLVTTVLLRTMEYTPKKRHQTSELITSETQPHSWHGVFFYKEFWFVTVIDITIWGVKISVVDWIQIYITEEMKHSTAAAARCAAVCEVGAVVAKLSLSFLSDYLLKRRLLVRQGLCPRAPLLLVLTLLVAVSTHLYAFSITPDSSELWLMVVFFAFGFSTGGLLTMCSLSLMECVPANLSATALGIGDCSSHLVGRSLLGYTVLSYVANHPLGGWSTSYLLVAFSALTALVTALLLFASPSTAHNLDDSLR